MLYQSIIYIASASANSCAKGSLLGFPTWYHYLRATTTNGVCSPQLDSLSAIWLIGAAVLEILLRIAALAAVIYLIYGGVTYIISQGEPDKIQKAKSTIINALLGMVLAVSATGLVAFIAGRIQ
jgi:hypothetical protein